MKPVVFFDLDGVLTDFVRGSLAAHGRSIPPGEVRYDFWGQVGLTAEEFWRPLADRDFWAGLPPLADGMRLFSLVESDVGADRIGLLSSGLCPGSCDGKRDWLKRWLPGYEKRAVFCTTKELCAARCKLLIDDHDPNVDGFRAAGGHAVLAPRPWNKNHRLCDRDGSFSPEYLAECVAETLDAMRLRNR